MKKNDISQLNKISVQERMKELDQAVKNPNVAENFYEEGQAFLNAKTLKAKKQAMHNRVNFSMNKMNLEFSRILNNYLPKFEEQPKEVSLRLPKLKKVSEKKPTEMKLPKLKKV